MIPTVGQFIAFCDAMIEYHDSQQAESERKAEENREDPEGYERLIRRQLDLSPRPSRDREYENNALYHWGERIKWRVIRGDLPSGYWSSSQPFLGGAEE